LNGGAISICPFYLGQQNSISEDNENPARLSWKSQIKLSSINSSGRINSYSIIGDQYLKRVYRANKQESFGLLSRMNSTTRSKPVSVDTVLSNPLKLKTTLLLYYFDFGGPNTYPNFQNGIGTLMQSRAWEHSNPIVVEHITLMTTMTDYRQCNF
jgi:hypothetical protein